MNAAHINSMFDGISEEWKDIICRLLKPELTNTITTINKDLSIKGKTVDCLAPPPRDIFNAFRITPYAKTRVVLIGQDPYIGVNEAVGLSFSVRGTKIPPSLKNIFACLLKCGLIDKAPEHGDLTNWAQQGVLLLNLALTTEIGKSNCHTAPWTPYTYKFINEFSMRKKGTIFILLGNNAQSIKPYIATGSVIFSWGHPSPLNTANRTDGPNNFKNCDCFIRTNDSLIARGETPIDWSVVPVPVAPVVAAVMPVPTPLIAPVPVLPVAPAVAPVPVLPIAPVHDNYIFEGAAEDDDPAPLDGNIYVFTDGGSKANGKANCKSSWGFYVNDGFYVTKSFGIVMESDIKDVVFKSSNNRGELTAIYNALIYIHTHMDFVGNRKVIIVSDSEYSIKSITIWIHTWLKDKAKLIGKKNLDLITPSKDLVDLINKQKPVVSFKHVRSHQDPPSDKESHEWFLWKGNEIVDLLCNKALGRGLVA